MTSPYTKVTISGLICTGKTTLFWNLQKKLTWPSFSASQFFRDYSRTHNLSLETAAEQNNRLTREVDEHMKKLIIESKNIIVEGWMAGIMAKDLPAVLRVLLTCDFSVRVRRFADREQVAPSEAENRIRTREKNLFDKLKDIYNRDDFVDPSNFNLVIDTTSLSSEPLLEMVYKLLI